jgi:hypothetical protein
MAGDWIKMRGNLWDDPRVSRLCDLTDQSEAAIVGGLYWLWATADQHTENGVMPGLTIRQIDRKTGVQGLGQALCDIGWVADHPEGVRIVNFEEHNGSSAKRRATDAQRKATGRTVSASDADKQRTEDGQNAPDCGAREEKRREEKKEQEKQPSVVGAERAPRPAKKCPASFEITPDLLDWAALEAPSVDFRAETEKFRDHTFKTARSDWAGTWRNWMRTASENVRAPPMSFRERDAAIATARVHEMTGGLVSAKAPRRDALQEVFDAIPRKLG